MPESKSLRQIAEKFVSTLVSRTRQTFINTHILIVWPHTPWDFSLGQPFWCRKENHKLTRPETNSNWTAEWTRVARLGLQIIRPWQYIQIHRRFKCNVHLRLNFWSIDKFPVDGNVYLPLTPFGIFLKSFFPSAFWSALKVQLSVPVNWRSSLQKSFLMYKTKTKQTNEQ